MSEQHRSYSTHSLSRGGRRLGPGTLPKPYNPAKKTLPPAPPRTDSIESEQKEPVRQWTRSKSISYGLDVVGREGAGKRAQTVTHSSKPLKDLLPELILPSLVRVTKGYQGYCEEDSLSEQEVFVAETFVTTKVVVGVDCEGKKITMPTNSTFLFTPIRQDEDIVLYRNIVCDRVSELLSLHPLPLAVMATKANESSQPKQSFSSKEVIFPLGIVKSKGLRGKKALMAVTASGQELELPSDTVGGFIISPAEAAVTIGYLVKFINGNFPCKVLVQEDSSGQGFQKVVTLTGVSNEVTFILRTLHNGQNGQPLYFEVPCDWPVEVESVRDDQVLFSPVKFNIQSIKKRFGLLWTSSNLSSLQSLAYQRVVYGTGEYTLHSRMNEVPGQPVVVRRHSDNSPPQLSSETPTTPTTPLWDTHPIPHTTTPPIPNKTAPPIPNKTTPPIPRKITPPICNKTAPPIPNKITPSIPNKTTPTEPHLMPISHHNQHSHKDGAHYAEITIGNKEAPPPHTTSHGPSNHAVLSALSNSHQDYVDMSKACTKSNTEDMYEPIFSHSSISGPGAYSNSHRADISGLGAYSNSHRADIPSKSGLVSAPSSEPSGSDPYIRALQEENNRLEITVKKLTDRAHNLEVENIDLRAKLKGMETYMRSSTGIVMPPSRDSFTSLPAPEPATQTPEEEDQLQKKNVAYIAKLDDDQVIDLLVAMSLHDYIDTFRREGIDGALLAELTAEDLQQLGVTSALHLKKFRILLDGRTSAYQKLSRLAGKST